MDEKYANTFKNQILAKGIEEDKVYDYYEKAIYKYENSKLNESWIADVVKKIKSANIVEFNNIPKQLSIDNIKYNIDKYSQRKYEEADFIKDDIIEEIVEEIQKNLQQFFAKEEKNCNNEKEIYIIMQNKLENGI